MTKSEIINSFNSISPSNSYSKNGNLFEKVIQYRSYKSLINRLKNPIKLTKMSFIEEFKLKYPYDATTLGIQDEYFSDSEIKVKIENEENNKNNDKNKNNNKNKDKNKDLVKKFNILNYKKNVDYIHLDPFKYNPNYNSIYKNVPSTKIFLPSKEYLQAKINKNKVNKNFFLTNIFDNQNNELLLKTKKNKITENNNNNKNIVNNNKNKRLILTSLNKISSMKNIKYLPNLKIMNKPKIIKSIKSESNIKNINKNNHALRFSKYVQRKWQTPKNNNDILSYINPSSYSTSKKIKTIDFKKMKPHSLKNLLNLNIIKNPSICYYEPKYDTIDTKFSFFSNKKEIDKKIRAKKIIQKIWSSYDVHKEYVSINNDILNKNDNYKSNKKK